MRTIIAKVRRLYRLSREQPHEWAELRRYANAPWSPGSTVFLGDSLTADWRDLETIPGCLNRGIGGQKTAQLLARFQQDVVALLPKAVHIMGGTNDLLRSRDADVAELILANVRSMTEIAIYHAIVPIVAAIPPCDEVLRRTTGRMDLRSEINSSLAIHAATIGAVFVDYDPILAADGCLQSDGIHITQTAYAAMKPRVIAAINAAASVAQCL